MINSYLYSDIFYFQGTSSSGKSTLIQSIYNQWQDLEVIEEDTIIHKHYVEAIYARFPSEMNIIKEAIASNNLFHALKEKDVLFKKNLSKKIYVQATQALLFIHKELNNAENISWNKEISRGIDNEIIRRIQQAIILKKNILLDSWKIKPKQLNLLFPETIVHRVLVYCPLQIAYERFLKRNEEASIKENFTEKRYLKQIFASYVSLYQIINNSELSLQEVAKQEVEEIFDIMLTSLQNKTPSYPIFTVDEISQELFLRMKSEFLRPFEIENETYYLVPKEKFDIIINSKTYNIKQILLILSNSLSGSSFRDL